MSKQILIITNHQTLRTTNYDTAYLTQEAKRLAKQECKNAACITWYIQTFEPSGKTLLVVNYYERGGVLKKECSLAL